MHRLLAVPLLSLALIALALPGCATGQAQQEVSPQEYAKPRETIQAAQAMGASEIPRARMFLQYAKDQVGQADRAIDKGDNKRARRLLARAGADADLAFTLAKERRMRREVQQIEHRIQRLEQQME